MLLVKAVCTLILVGVAMPNNSVKENKIASYDPGELLARIFNPNTTISSRQRGYGLVFEDQLDPQTPEEGNYGLDHQRLKFEDDQSNAPIKFEDDGFQGNGNRHIEDQRQVQVTFQDDNAIKQGNKKRRRRRRKPKNGLQNNGGVYPVVSHLQAGRPGFPEPGLGPNPYPAAGFVPNYNVNTGLPGPAPYRRRRRPRPSLASDALSAVTGALTSIALYDDYQCVPRLLCEAAGGGSLGSAGVLDSIAGIQPLLTLLSVYNGISSSPLFVFGRAVFLGMTSRGNTGTCRYAYPQCPTDPEQLIHYLNNHNGGFFRFFNAPLPNQNLEQFYNHLGQNGFNPGQDLGGQTDFGQYGQPQGQGGYGLYQNQQGQGYDFQNNHIGNRPGLYGQNYGSNYDYNTYGSNVRFKDSNTKIEKRIQNKPLNDDDNLDENNSFDSKWQFPDDAQSNTDDSGPIDAYNIDESDKDTDSLKFPEESKQYDDKQDTKRKGKSILFPENQFNQNAYSNKNYVNIGNQNKEHLRKPYYHDYDKITTERPNYQYNYNHNYNNYIPNNNIYKGTTSAPFNENDYFYDHKHNFYVKKDNNNNNYKYQSQVNNFYNNKDYNKENYNNYVNSQINDYVNAIDDGAETIYVVRGNGDPSRPEIIKVKPGQTVN